MGEDRRSPDNLLSEALADAEEACAVALATAETEVRATPEDAEAAYARALIAREELKFVCRGIRDARARHEASLAAEGVSPAIANETFWMS